MKKLLGILSAISITASSSVLVVSCKSNGEDKNDDKDVLDLSNLTIRNGLDEIDLKKMLTINKIEDSCLDSLNKSYDNAKNASLGKDVSINFYKDKEGKTFIKNYDDVLPLTNLYVKFIANSSSQIFKNETKIITFKLINNNYKEPLDLSTVAILNGLNVIDLNKTLSTQEVEQSCLDSLSKSYYGEYDLSLTKDVSINFYKDKEGLTAIRDYNDMLSLSNLYVKFISKSSSKILKNRSNILSYQIKQKNASNEEIADSIIEQIKNKINEITISNSQATGVSKKDIENEVKKYLPNQISIENRNTSDFNINNISIVFDDSKKTNYENGTYFLSIKYIDFISLNKIEINITNNDNEIASSVWTNRVANFFNTLELSSSLINNDEVNNKIIDQFDVFNVLDMKAEDFNILNKTGQIVREIGGVENGIFEYSIYNKKEQKLLINKASDDQENNTIFSLNLTTSKQIKYKELFNKFDEFNNSENKSMNLRDISLLSFIPSSALSKFKNQVAIKDLLENITLDNFIDWFFNPNGKYAKYMPRVMPIVSQKSQGIDMDENGENKEFWNFINLIANDLNEKHINIKNGDLAVDNYETKISGYKTTIHFDLYKILLNIMPDIIHFHNYIINNNTSSNNYLLMFIKYLLDEVHDYNINQKNDNIKFDNFARINHNVVNLKTNFDSLIHNLLSPFIGVDNKTNNQQNSGTEAPIWINIEVIPWVSNILDWTVLAKNVIPSEVLFKDLFNKILSPKEGQDINKDVTLNLTLTFNFIGRDQKFNQDVNINLASLHISEIKSLIKNDFNFGSYFDNSKIETISGYLYLIGKDKNDNWSEIHSLDNISNFKDIKFEFRDFYLRISDNEDLKILFEKQIPNFYLNL